MVTFGLRVGAVAMTTRDFGEPRPVSYQVVARLLASRGHMAAPRFQPALVSKMRGVRASQTTKLSRSIENSK
jgi:hypothetical protein